MIVYIAHKIRGDVSRNKFIVRNILRHLARQVPLIIPIAPYLTALSYLDDADDDERYIGMLINKAHFEKRFIDQLWVYGERSLGVQQEVDWACEQGIPVYFHEVPEEVVHKAELYFRCEGSKL